MLGSLYIKNFRNLKELKINTLGRVNLFTGKNNTGKSSVLEAIAIYASKGDLNIIHQLLKERGDNFINELNKKSVEGVVKILSFLFYNRVINTAKKDSIIIGPISQTLLGNDSDNEGFISIRFVHYFDEVIYQNEVDGNVSKIRKRIIIDSESRNRFEELLGFEISSKGNQIILDPSNLRIALGQNLSVGDKENYQFIRTSNIDSEFNSKRWDEIALTYKEKIVIDALKIIEPTAERITFLGESSKERVAVVKLENNNTVLPLRSMGDGINRILTIILALVNAENGYLLIDEFENGLHYSVQKQLWEIIFKLSEQLNIQVFATTHSNDCISSFEKVLNTNNNAGYGKFIRLDKVGDIIKEVEFDASELKIAQEQNIEIR